MADHTLINELVKTEVDHATAFLYSQYQNIMILKIVKLRKKRKIIIIPEFLDNLDHND